MTEQPSITCPRCGRTSYHPEDIRSGYCGACHAYTTPKGGRYIAIGNPDGPDTGILAGYAPGTGYVRVMLSPDEEITDPDRAEQLGLTVEARRLRERP